MNSKLEDFIESILEQSVSTIEVPLEEKVYGENAFRRHKIFDRQKFAELIIQECCLVADRSVEYGMPSEDIKLHFGIES